MRGNRYRGVCHCGDHAFAVLTRGYVGYVSPEDAHLLRSRSWNAHKEARGAWKVIGSDNKKLHREIMGDAAQGNVVDHKNGDAFDNRRSNLRVCEQAHNALNQKRRGNKVHSCYKGVTRTTTRCVAPWRAAICVGGRRFHLGTFHNERDAAVAYDAAALRLHGEFARTNASLGLL